MSTTTSIKAYLAQKYMSGPKADAILARSEPKKKKKRKQTDGGQQSHSGVGIGIVDDDGGWGAAVGEDEDNDLAEAVIASDRAFKKRKVADGDSGGWISVGPPEKPPTPPPEEDEQPVIVEDESATRGGLLSQAELQKRFGAQTKKLKEDLPTAEQQETVYRDASGRKIDTKAERAEAARRKREQEEMDAKRMQWGKGIVQREETEENRKQMERDRLKGFARHADDADLNAAQKDEMRWNDPAAAFLSDKGKKKGPKKPIYTGPPPPPNRFGILPGYRWDGVDRSNGFEKKYFQRQNERSRKTTEAHNWSVDDM